MMRWSLLPNFEVGAVLIHVGPGGMRWAKLQEQVEVRLLEDQGDRYRQAIDVVWRDVEIEP